MWREGFIGGLLGAAAVALLFLFFDLLFREAFWTPAALGSALFRGATSAAEIRIDLATVLLYTVVHIGAFVLLGLIASAFFTGADREPSLIVALALLFVTQVPIVIGFLYVFRSWVLGALGFWAVLLGAAVGAGTVAFYLSSRHPGAAAKFRRETGPEAGQRRGREGAPEPPAPGGSPA